MKRPYLFFRFCFLAIAAIGVIGLSDLAWGQTETVLYNFQGLPADGGQPHAGLIADSAGNLYGTTQSDGTHSMGTVFRLSPSGSGWVETVLYNFGSIGPQDGGAPQAPLVLDSKGRLYGTTYGGGIFQSGTAFRLSPPTGSGPWTETIMYQFCSDAQVLGYCLDGQFPVGPLTLDAAGNLYGMTQWGGQRTGSQSCDSGNFIGCGIVFELSPFGNSWNETILHVFLRDGTDGNHPSSGALLFDKNGVMYGATQFGGDINYCSFFGCGAVFKMTVSGGVWSESVIHSFGDGSAGTSPIGLALDAAGNLYGTTSWGGNGGCSSYVLPGCGVVFELMPGSPTWTYSLPYQFQGGNDGASPQGAPALDSAGRLYGTTYETNQPNNGTVFRLTPVNGGWSKTTLHAFGNAPDGSNPNGAVMIRQGVLYGVTAAGGSSGNGTVYKIVP